MERPSKRHYYCNQGRREIQPYINGFLCADGQLDLQKPSGLALLLPGCKAASCAYQPKNRRLHRFICIFVPNLCVTWMPTWEDSQWQQLHALCVLGELINRS